MSNLLINLMINSRRLFLCALLPAAALTGAACAQASGSLTAYNVPQNRAASKVFTVTASNGTSVAVPVADFFTETDGTPQYSFAHVALAGTANFVLTMINGDTVTNVDIGPHSYGLTGTSNTNTAAFSVTQNTATSPAQIQTTYLVVSVTVKNAATGNLHVYRLVVACDPPEIVPTLTGSSVYKVTDNGIQTGTKDQTAAVQALINKVSSNGGGTIYFTKGLYTLENGISLASKVTLYLDPDATIASDSVYSNHNLSTTPNYGQNVPTTILPLFIIPGGVNNVAITGRGVIDGNAHSFVNTNNGATGVGEGTQRMGLIWSTDTMADGSANTAPNGISLNGITLVDATTWSNFFLDSKNVTVKDVKLLNDINADHNDGYDVVSTSTATVDNSFAMNGDDVFDAKAFGSGNTSGVVYSNGVAYAGHGDGTKVGVQAKSTIDGVVFSNIGIVTAQRAASVSHDEGSSSVQNIHFNDVWMDTMISTSDTGEYASYPFLVWVYNKLDSSGDSEGVGPVSDITFSRLTVNTNPGTKALVQGYSSAANVSGVTLQDVSIGGTVLSSSNASQYLTVGSDVSGVLFGITSGTVYTLVSKYTDLALTNPSSACGVGATQTTVALPVPAGQAWTLTAVSPNVYTIQSQTSGCVLTSSPGAQVQLAAANKTLPTTQQWTISSSGTGVYSIVNVADGQALDDHATYVSGGGVYEKSVDGDTKQQWYLTSQ